MSEVVRIMLNVFLGQNTTARDKAVKDFINKFISVNGDMSLDKLNAEDLSFGDLIDAVTTVPFLSTKKTVLIKYLSANKELADKIDQVLIRLADTTELVIIETNLDSRSVYSKNLKKYADSFNTFSNLEGLELVEWVVSETKSRGGIISKDDALYLADRLGQNQQILSSEIDKLLLLEDEIKRQNIDAMTENSPHSSIFNMIDSLMQGKLDTATRLYEQQRQQGMEPQAIMGMITWQLTNLAHVVVGKGDSPDEISKRAKISPFVVRKNVAVAKNISKQKLLFILDLAINTDLKIKTGKIKADAGVYTLLLDIAKEV